MVTTVVTYSFWNFVFLTTRLWINSFQIHAFFDWRFSVLVPFIRLSSRPNRGYVQIKDGLIWRYVQEENWDLTREKMLCQHLGFRETDADVATTGSLSCGTDIATGDLICYKTQPRGTSCCVQLQSSTVDKRVKISYARCKRYILKIITCFNVLVSLFGCVSIVFQTMIWVKIVEEFNPKIFWLAVYLLGQSKKLANFYCSYCRQSLW